MTNHENTHDTTNLTLVLGATGKSGRRVAERLQAHGVPVWISSRPLFGFILGTAIVYGLVSGVFYAFSSFVMQGLRDIPAPQGIAAMQSINVTALRPPFMPGFMGAAVLSVVAVVIAIVRWGKPGSVWLIVGAVLYLVGSFAVTMVFNVPLNNALVAADPATPEAAELWTRYLQVWTNWNTLRMIASAAASGAFVNALVSSTTPPSCR